MSSPERELLQECYFFIDNKVTVSSKRLLDRIDKLLAQPEQEPVAWMYEEATSFNKDGYFSEWLPCFYLEKADEDKSLRNETPLYASPQKREPPQTAREMYQRGYAAAERDLKRKPLSAEEIKQTTQGMSEFGADMFKAGVVTAEKAHGIGKSNER